MERSSGILLHVTCLPGADGIGDIASAYPFIDWLADNLQSVWQVLPLNPPDSELSPYSSCSSHAGYTGLISLDLLTDNVFPDNVDLRVSIDECRRSKGDPAAPGRPDQRSAAAWKYSVLAEAADLFSAGHSRFEEFEAWSLDNAEWLDDDAMFHAISLDQGTADWTHWPAPLRRRDPAAISLESNRLATLVHRWRFVQWVFDSQWSAMKRYANERGVSIMGDVPIYCAHASVDVWAAQQMFQLADDGMPLAVAGVPPDYFSATGQRWGNPLYDWSVHRQEGFKWWVRRVGSALRRCDMLRLDHFRALESFWRIPAHDPDATTGSWVPGPGRAFFDALQVQLGHLPLLVEDLGTIDEQVKALRDSYQLPGMCVLQFAFDGDPNNPYLPHAQSANRVIYTGTHDNDTAVGWWQTASRAERRKCRSYLNFRSQDIHRVLCRAAAASVCNLAIIPMQDLLGLGTQARMNHPGHASDQWQWRFDWASLTASDSRFLRDMTSLYGRAAPDTDRNHGALSQVPPA